MGLNLEPPGSVQQEGPALCLAASLWHPNPGVPGLARGVLVTCIGSK